MLNMYDFRKVSSERGDAPARAGLAPMVFEHDSFRRGGQGELYLVQRRKRKKPEDARRDADREAEVASLRSRITELERRLSQLEWRTRSSGRATIRSSSREVLDPRDANDTPHMLISPDIPAPSRGGARALKHVTQTSFRKSSLVRPKVELIVISGR